MTRPEADCVFCEIVGGRLPARFLYAEDTVVAFLDIAPATRGHALVVPRAHSRDLWEIEDTDLAAVSVVTRRVASALRDALGAPGLLVHQVSGEAAGQDVFHYHVHLVPRYEDDAVQPGWGSRAAGWHAPALSEAELDELAERVAAALGALGSPPT